MNPSAKIPQTASGDGEGEEGRRPGGAWRVDQLAGLGDVAVLAHRS